MNTKEYLYNQALTTSDLTREEAFNPQNGIC